MPMGTCGTPTGQLMEYLDGHLSLGRRLGLRWHMGRCTACRVSLQQLMATAALLQEIPVEPLPDGVRDDLLARFRAMPRQPRAAAARSPGLEALAFVERVAGSWSGLVAAGVALAAAALFAVARDGTLGAVGQGFRCLAVALGGGLLPAAIGFRVAVAARVCLSAGALAVLAAAGGWGAFALLFFNCPHRAGGHVLVFHVGGMAVAIALAMAASGLSAARAR